jgi:hypothetical protein
MSYQAVVRNTAGVFLVTILMLDTNKHCKPQQLVQQFILKDHYPTNANGLASIEIGGTYNLEFYNKLNSGYL